tara:strand:+ start:85236 stop:85715 length:480 start_codon:yes stop_codon:yes gene_type:complete
MKRQLIYHTHVNTSQLDKIVVKVQTESKNSTCYLDRISRDGLTLSCDSETLHSILPNKTVVAPKDPVSMNTTFALDKSINALCRVIFARRLSKDHFIMELKFVDINEQAKQDLDDYIEKTLRSELKPTEDCKIQPEPKIKSSEIYKINNDLRITYSKVA